MKSSQQPVPNDENVIKWLKNVILDICYTYGHVFPNFFLKYKKIQTEIQIENIPIEEWLGWWPNLIAQPVIKSESRQRLDPPIYAQYKYIYAQYIICAQYI